MGYKIFSLTIEKCVCTSNKFSQHLKFKIAAVYNLQSLKFVRSYFENMQAILLLRVLKNLPRNHRNRFLIEWRKIIATLK